MFGPEAGYATIIQHRKLIHRLKIVDKQIRVSSSKFNAQPFILRYNPPFSGGDVIEEFD